MVEDVVLPAIFSFQFPDTPVFTGLFLNFSGIRYVYYNGKPSVCKVLYPKFPKQPNRELAENNYFIKICYYKTLAHYLHDILTMRYRKWLLKKLTKIILH